MNANGTRSPWRPVRAFALVVATLVGSVLVAGSVPAAGPPAGMGPGGHDEGIAEYVAPAALSGIGQDGTGLVRLTQGPGYNAWSDNHPSVRADGAIVFSSTRPAADASTDAEIWMLAGGTLVQLTDNTTVVSDETGAEEPINDLNPVFSPDGTKVAYQSPPVASDEAEEEGGGSSGGSGGPPAGSGLSMTQIWVLDVATKTTEQVTSIAASTGAAKYPTWSPDGTKIAFTLGDGTRQHIVALDLASGALQDVTPEGNSDSMAAWSPADGNVIAFTRGLGSAMDIYAKNLSTGAVYPLATTAEMESRPAWTHDGTLIAYQHGDESLGASIWLMGADGSDQHAITTATSWSDRWPAVAADGTIVFESTQDAVPAADLRITKTGEPDTVAVGQTVTYTVSVVNGGPLTAAGVTLVDTLPAGMQYVSGQAAFVASSHGEGESEDEVPTPTTPVVRVAGNVVTASFGDVAKSERRAVVATLVVVAKATAPGTQVNSASISLTAPGERPDLVDPLGANNTATATTTVVAGGPTADGGTSNGASPTPAPAPVLIAPAPASKPARGPVPTIVGTAGDDVLIGTPGRDVILAGAGNDRIAGHGGNDVILGGDGNDVIYGGPGDDVLNGGAGNDVIYGKAGHDVLYGGPGNDTLVHVKGEGVDAYYAGAGNDRLVARDGNADWLNGGLGRDLAVLDKGLDRTHSVEKVR